VSAGTRAETVGRAEFETFVNGLGLGRPSIGLQGVGFALIVPPGTEAAVAAQIDAEYGTERGIWPKTDQAMRTSIVLLEPDDLRNRAAVGFDMYTEPTRRAAMIAAMTDPDAVATGPVVLVQEIGPVPQAGILIYLYLSPQGRAGEGGFVYSPIRLGDLFQAALDRAGERFDLSAIDTAAPDRPLFLSPGFDGDGGRTRLAAATTLRIATREWVLSGQAQTPFHLFRGHPFTVVTGIAAFLFALATGLAVQGLTAAIRRARALNAAQEVLMREKDLHLREMSHRLKNALARVVAMARQAARGAGTKEEYVAAMTSRLQAMADAQDMLTRAGGTADLRALHQVEALVDVVERQRVGDHRVDLDLAVHVPVDDLRHVGAAARAAEGGALPDAAGDQLERPGRDFLARRRHADDHRLCPSRDGSIPAPGASP
jgi:CHASE1-domain containing sensor protein